MGDIMEFKKELLKGTVVARGYSMQDVAEWLDINLSTLYRKISRNGDFSRAEIKILTKRLNLDEQERDSIFFGISLTKTQERKIKIMEELKVFENAEFGSVRTTTVNGEIMFVGKDVAEILGYSNPRKAIIDHIDEEDKGVTKCDTLGGKQDLTMINRIRFVQSYLIKQNAECEEV